LGARKAKKRKEATGDPEPDWKRGDDACLEFGS
jgi:hypothetical protein